jgi:hypothetical protein
MATLIIIFTAYQYLNAIKYLKASGDNSRILVLSVNKNDNKQIKMLDKKNYVISPLSGVILPKVKFYGLLPVYTENILLILNVIQN